MIRRLILWILVPLCLLLISCASLVDKGNELYEQGLYQEAADFFQQALNEDPYDVEAKVGLSNARLKIIDRGLIEVRMMREGANFKAAAEKLEYILFSQTHWNVEITSNIAFTQKEEITYAGRWLRDEIERLSKSRFPDQFAWYEFAFKTIILNAGLSNWVFEKKQHLIPVGKKFCKKLVSDITGEAFYSKPFVIAYCGRWDIVDQSITIQQNDTERFGKINTMETIKISRQNSQLMRDTLNQSLVQLSSAWEQTPWYHPASNKELSLKVTGNINYTHKKRYSKRVANYQVVNSITDKNTGQTTQRTVNKKHQYRVTEHKEALSVAINIKTFLANRMYQYALNDSTAHETISHNEDFPAAQLTPESANLMDVDDWLKKNLDKLVNEVKKEANLRWKERYCKHPPAQLTVLENALRCGKLDIKNPRVNEIFEQFFGINYQQMIRLQPIE